MPSNMPPVHVGDDVIHSLREQCYPIINEKESNPEFKEMAWSHLNAVLGQSLQRYYDYPADKRIAHAQYETGEVLKSWYEGVVNPYPPPSFSPVHPNPLVGILGVDNKGFKDANGYVYPIGLHFGDGFLNYCEDNSNAQRAMDLIDTAAELGYHFTRFWAPLMWFKQGGPNHIWHNRGCSPDVTPDFYTRLTEFIQYHVMSKMKVQVSVGDLNNVSQDKRVSLYNNFADIISSVGVEHFLYPGEVNESQYVYVGSSPNDIITLVDIIRRRHPNLLYALSSYTGNPDIETVRKYTAPFQKTYYKHGYRYGHYWDKIRHVFSDGYEYYKQIREFGSDHEGPGVGPLVSDMHHPEEMDGAVMGLLAVMAALSSQTYVYFCSPGIRMGEDFNTMPGFHTVPKLVAMLPRGLTAGLLHHSGPSFANKRVFDAVGEFRVDGCLREDTGEFAYVGYGPGDRVKLPINRTFTGKLINAETLEVTNISGQSGTRLPEIGYNKGFVLTGQV